MNVVLFAEIIIMATDLKSLVGKIIVHNNEIKSNLLQFFFLTCVISN